jgi:UDP-GlcNAc:undecaprenyl-phosphate/decaprenyl-phosphate GlcNAc-1-phosphate transferase
MSQYKTYMVVLLVAAAGAFMLTPSVIRLALTWGAVDHPSSRKVHQKVMPRMGGLAVYFAFCLPWAGLYLIDNPVSAAFRDFEKRFAVLVFGATTMLLLGIYDDLKGANAGKKLIVQVGAAFVLWAGGIRIEDLAIPWSDPIDLNWFSLPVTILWIVGVTNAINLLDGIDGLVTGVTAVMAICLAIINVLSGNILLALLTLSLAGACLGFLPYNHSPARIFLGDTGSLTIGIVLGGIGVLSPLP